MRTRHTLLMLIALTVILVPGCVRAVSDETPIPPTPTITPPVPFDLVPAVTPTSSLPPSLYLDPSVIDLAVDGTATVSIWLDGAQRLNRIRLELSFDPTYAQVEDADPNSEGVQIAAGTIPEPRFVSENRVEGGRVYYEAALEPSAAVNGNGLVASITLRGLSEGVFQLRFESVSAFDPEGTSLGITPFSDGLVTVAGAAAAQPTAPPIAQPTAPPLAQPTAPPVAQPTAVTSEQGIYYIVQPGENLFRIGLKFGVSGDAVAAANAISDPTQLSVGQMLVVPVAPPRGRFGYYVQPGDTLYSIAARFGATVEQVATWSGLGTDYTISVGQILTVSP